MIFERGARGAAKVFYRAIWKTWACRAKRPLVDVLYKETLSEEMGNESIVLSYSGALYVEPTYGYLITGDGLIFEDSLTPNMPFPKRPFQIMVPSPFRFLRAVRYPKQYVLETHSAVSLRHFWEWNYYHFYFDVLGKLELLHKAGVSPSMPLIIGKYAIELPFVKSITAIGGLSGAQWMIPEREYIKAENVLVCRTRTLYRDRICYLLDRMKLPIDGGGGDLRLFINRSGNRRIRNINDIIPILRKYGFEIIDTAKMPINDQICLFSNARYVIAIHGAGTTNILFRGDSPLSLLELHHEKLLNYDHKRICDEMGYSWQHLEGVMQAGRPEHADFTVDPSVFEKRVLEFLSN